MDVGTLTGSTLGRYRLGAVLGEGATGVVLEAAGSDGAAVAIKILRSEIAGDGPLRARFQREEKLARGIHSSHVARVIDVGEARGLMYLVLPLYPGGSLAQRLRDRGRLDVDETVALAAELGRGLDELHRHGIVHRDVKPSNVLFDAESQAVLTDFGLARGEDSTRLTLDGQLLGTPAYLAPELIEGRQATSASDVYALSCVLYECLVGEPPFVGRRLAELGFSHLVEPPPDPRGRREDVPAGVVEALLAGLEKDPAVRPTTATALARMLHLGHSAGRARSADR